MKVSSILPVVFLIIGLISGLALGSVINVHTATVVNVVVETKTIESRVPVEKTVTMTTTVTATEATYKTTRSAGATCAIFKAAKDVYGMSEEVVLVLENNCDHVLVLPNAAPWMITGVAGEVVFSPLAAQVITEIGPGDVVEWTWAQIDNDGDQVPAGTYRARLTTINAGTFVAEFKIIGT
ncbi:MAG: hypothetical protein RMI78_05765 [Nitrososphaerota archaeon]|nr:hypothetical protein [Nitrososphaerota archaeon]